MSLTSATPIASSRHLGTGPLGEPCQCLRAGVLVASNLAVFAAGVLGAILLGTAGSLAVPLTMTIFAIVALLVIVASRRSVYPGR